MVTASRCHFMETCVWWQALHHLQNLKMKHYRRYICLIALLDIAIQTVLSENDTNVSAADSKLFKDANNRRMFVIDKSATNNGQHLTSHKIATKTFTTHLTTKNDGSQSLHGWVSKSQNEGHVILQPQVHSIVQTQEGCRSGDAILANTPVWSPDQASILQKKSTIENSQSFNGDNSFESVTFNSNQWKSDQSSVKAPLMVEQLGGQSKILQGTTSQHTVNNVRDMTRTTNDNSHGLNALYHGTNNIQKDENIIYPDNSYKVSVSASGDGIYANQVTGQHTQNLNVIVPTDSSSNIVAVPVLSPQFGRVTVEGYRPNIQYYLRQTETSKLLNNPLTIQKVPSFIEQFKPDQTNIHLSEDQLNSYKQYLIQTGLIKLKPYQLIFSDQFQPKLRTLQWMVVPLESNLEYCKQRCGSIFPRNTLYSTITENLSKLPLKLLVPVLKIRSGVQKTITGMHTVAGGVGDISSGMYRMIKDAPSHVIGLLKEKPDESKTTTP